MNPNDININVIATVVAASAAVVVAVFAIASWRLQRINYTDNRQYKERLIQEERHFKVHMLWQELRIAAVTLQNLPQATSDFAPQVDGLPIAKITEALATKDLVNAAAATKIRILRDDLIHLEQFAGDARSPEVRRAEGFERKFAELQLRSIASLDEAREAIIEQLPSLS